MAKKGNSRDKREKQGKSLKAQKKRKKGEKKQPFFIRNVVVVAAVDAAAAEAIDRSNSICYLSRKKTTRTKARGVRSEA